MPRAIRRTLPIRALENGADEGRRGTLLSVASERTTADLR
jgi:hypothetical protein